MVKAVFLFPNGAVAVTDENGQQVPEWQTNVFCDHLRKMLEAGAVTNETSVHVSDGPHGDGTVAAWIGPA